ncbi:MAG: hypothetical protein PHC94_00770 [Methylobacter sp.]|nr:hypothetical protein [Methylococcales bacterium]MDD5112521.1 hypothetical protein [Methylobacter sp.]
MNNFQSFNIPGQARLPIVWRTPALIFLGLGCISLLLAEYTAPDNWKVLGFICITSLIYAFQVLQRELRDGAMRLITDPFLILIAAFSLYDLLGALLPVLGSDDQVYLALNWYPTTAQDAVYLTGINLIGLATLLLSASFFNGKSMDVFMRPFIVIFADLPIRLIFWLFAIIGSSISLHIFYIDISDNEIVNGSIRILSSLAMIAILIGIIYRGKGEKFLYIVAIFLTLIHSLSGFILMSKAAILSPFLVLMIAFYIRKQNAVILIITVVITSISLTFLMKPILDGRAILAVSPDKSISARLDILRQVYSADNNNINNDPGPGAWYRICYIGAQNAGVDFYNHDQGGNDIDNVGWVFLPRIFFKNKPVISNSGSDFNAKVTGSDTSSSSMGVFISGYYNLGWLGLFAVSIISAIILSLFSAFSRVVATYGAVILLPVAQIGSYIAFRVDGDFLNDYLGLFSMIMSPLLILILIVNFYRSIQ